MSVFRVSRILAVLVAFFTVVSIAQAQSTFDVAGQPLHFTGNGTGTGVAVNSTRTYTNVITIDGHQIDATVTLTALSNAAIYTAGTPANNFDSTANPYAESNFFQPNINFSAAGGFARFRFQFADHATGLPVTLLNVYANTYDLDGSNAAAAGRQYTEFSNIAGYTLSATSQVTRTDQGGGVTRFTTTVGGNRTDTIGSNGFNDIRARVYFASASDIEITVGDSGAAGIAFFGIDFSLGYAFGNASPGVNFTSSGGIAQDLTAAEGGATATIPVVLESTPSANVIVTFSDPTGECTFAPNPLTFTPANYATTQAVTVTAVDDTDIEGDHSCTPVATITSSDPNYNNFNVAEPTVTISDNDFAPAPSIKLTMTANTAGLTSPPRVGDVITYTMLAENTGNVPLTSVTLSDALTADETLTAEVGKTDDNELDVGEVWTYTASHTLTQADIDAGLVSNTATISAVDPSSTAVNDVSDSGDELVDGTDPDSDPTNDPTLTTLTAAPAVRVVHTTSVSGSTVTLTYALTNTGNVTLHDAGVTQTTFSGTGTAPTPAPDTSGGFNTGDTDADGFLDLGETWNYTATYTLTEADLLAGGVSSSATGTGTSPAAVVVTDLSDDGDELTDSARDADADPTNDPTFTVATAHPHLDLALTSALAGNVLTYTYTVTNDGDVALDAPVIDQATCAAAPCFTGAGSSLSAPAPTLSGAVNAGDSNGDGKLSVGEAWVYTATYTVVPADVVAGSVTHQASASSADANTTAVSDNSDVDGPAADGNGDTDFGNDPTVMALTATPAIDLTLTGIEDSGAGTITYGYLVENTGNVPLTTPALTQPGWQGTGAAPTITPVLVAGQNAGDTNTDGIFDPTEVWEFTATYTLQTGDYDRGLVRNSATATASFGATGVSDVSDGDNPATDGNSDGNAGNDPTVTPVTRAPAITLVKTATAASGTVSYSYALTNSGNVSLTAPDITETSADFTGTGTLPDPIYSTGDAAPIGVLDVGETWTYTADYTPTTADLNIGEISNRASATATPPGGGAAVTDTSDDDGTGIDDPTVTELVLTPAITLVKTASVAGNVVTYTYTVTNTGDVALGGIIVAENDDDFTGTDVPPAATYVSGDSNGDGKLDLTETWIYRGIYTAPPADLLAGEISSQATATGTDPHGTDVSDLSDADTDASNGSDSPTVTPLPAAELTISHSLTSVTRQFQTRYQAEYHLTLINDGPFPLTDVGLTNDLEAFVGAGNLIGSATATLNSGVCTLNSGFDGSGTTDLLVAGCSFAPGESVDITITFDFDTTDGFPTGDNLAVGKAAELATSVQDGEGLGITDTDNDGGPDGDESASADRDGDGIADARDYDPTGYFYCEEDGTILSGGSISITGPSGSNASVGTANGITIVKDGSDGEYQWFVSAAGSYTMTLTYPSSGDPSTRRTVSPTALDLTSLPADPTLIGSTESGSTGRLASAALADNPTFYTRFDIAAGDPNVMANNIPLKNCAAGVGPGVTVTNLDLLATESDSETAAMGFVLDTEPTAPVTLSFAGDAQCRVAPSTMTFTPANWDKVQKLTIIGRSDTVDEGAHTCTPTVVTSSTDLDYDAMSPALSPVTLTDSLVAAVQDQVRDKLVTDLKNTLQERQNRLRDMSAGAAERLAEPLDDTCDTPRDRLPHGSIDAEGSAVTINGTLNDMGDGCATEDRRIVQSEFALNRQEDGQTAIDLSVDLMRERRVDDFSIRGEFIGGYLRMPADDKATDQISGLGLQMGIYGADRKENGSAMDYYLAVGIGRHDYRFAFGSADPITASGNYGYGAGYGGLAWSRGREMGDLAVTPRAGIDLAIGVPLDASILAEQDDLSETGSIDMPMIGLLRFYGEVKVAGLDDPQVMGEIDRDWWVTPGLFCDVGFGDTAIAGDDCGLSMDVGWGETSKDLTRDVEIALEGELAQSRERLALSLRHIRTFGDGNGTDETGLSLGTSGELAASRQIGLKF